ncbi:uncharacterized protein LOC130736047 [Lotus japonicus]|uniref:uncharacterized protein LOC130736047 n=1 Tax=Lotus japonicus TaxID=34305 RepID=UPI00258B26D3|nr:uncharacterized protein LOC130736047 [Lotus japonicus]
MGSMKRGIFIMDIDGEKAPPDDAPQRRMSFRDKLMGGAVSLKQKQVEDLVELGKMKIELVDGNRLLPSVTTDSKVLEDMSAPWKESLIVCLLGKRLGYRIMKSKLTSIWKLSGDFELLDVGNGFFMVKFDIPADREKVVNGGPWMIFDHYLAVSTWSREFVSPAARVNTTLAWIRIPGLNVVFYDESYLLSVARALGRPIKVDMNTLNADRGRFARICVELDLTLPVVGKVCIEGFWYKIEYEGLHVICTKCGCYGHHSRECKVFQPVIETSSQLAQPSEGIVQGNPSAPAAGNPSTQVAANPSDQASAVKEVTGNSAAVSDDTEDLAMNTGDISGHIDESVGNEEGEKPKLKVALDGNFEILGDWMTVVKKKKKQSVRGPVFKAQPALNNTIMGKSKNNHGERKTRDPMKKVKEVQKRNEIPMVGDHTHVGFIASESKKRRFRNTGSEVANGTYARDPQPSNTNDIWDHHLKGIQLANNV